MPLSDEVEAALERLAWYVAEVAEPSERQAQLEHAITRLRKAVAEKAAAPAWRKRLTDALERDGRSWRAVSKAAGLSNSYIRSILNGGKDPTIAKLQAICVVLNVSAGYILDGKVADDPADRQRGDQSTG